MAVRSRRVAGPTTLATSSGVIYTVPAGRTLIVRSITLYNRGANSTSSLVMINGTTGAECIWLVSLATQTSTSFVVPLVLNPGDVLRAHTTQATHVAMTVFGSLLLGEPE